MIEFTSIHQMLEAAQADGLPLWEAILRADCENQGISQAESLSKMAGLLRAMEEADQSYRPQDRSQSGLVGGDGGKMDHYARQGDPLCGPFLSEVMAGALRMGECNACMKRIVAAPTAGACGVLPAVLLPYARRFCAGDDKLIEALYVASRYGGEEPAGAGVRPGGRPGGGALRQTERHRGHGRPVRRPDGPGGH